MLTANKLGIAFLMINGQRTNYMLDHTGEIYNFKTGKFLKVTRRKPNKSSNGTYSTCQLRVNGKKRRIVVSRERMIHFNPPSEEMLKEYGLNNLEVDHIIADLTNESFSNLQWLTKAQNLAKRKFDAPF